MLVTQQVSQTGVPFFGNTVLKLASHLARSRHGIYYFRLTYSAGLATKEKRISLRTKNPQEARLKASCLSAIMVTSKHDKQKAMDRDTYNAALRLATDEPVDGKFLERMLHRFDKQQLAHLTGRSQAEIESLLNPTRPQGVHKLELELPGGMVFRDINSDEDVGRVHQILKSLNLSPEALAQLIAGPNPQKVPVQASHNDAMAATISEEGGNTRILQPPINHAKPQPSQAGGTTIQEMVPRYATRKRNKLSSKALYEYGNYHRKFVQWLELRKKNKHIPVHAVMRLIPLHPVLLSCGFLDYVEDAKACGPKLFGYPRNTVGLAGGIGSEHQDGEEVHGACGSLKSTDAVS